MNTATAFGLMDVIILASGAYILYAWYLLAFKNEAKEGVIIPKDVNIKKCKDFGAFKNYLAPRTLIFGLAAVASGGIGLYQDYVQPLPPAVYWALYVVFFAAVVWYILSAKKAMKEFF